ncbi:hypothetical protein ACTWP5_22075 [Streptomyces sp. 4N509B]|uniref:hypothetical protein n=1 Tax=Streptomyces sp. 4N509B TaxID=3457413 RepID=UPI003FCFE2C8
MKHRVRGTGLVGVALLTLAGCASTDSDPRPTEGRTEPSARPSETPTTGETDSEATAEEWVRRAQDAVAEVTAARATGTMESQGRAIHSEVVRNGDACAATLDLAQLGVAEFVQIGDEAWIRPPDTSWLLTEGGRETLDTYADHYVHGDASHPGFQEESFGCDVSLGVLDAGSPDSEYRFRMGEDTTHDGQPAVTVLLEETNELGTSTLTVLIAAENEPLLLTANGEMTSEDGERVTVTSEWTDYGDPVPVTPPPADQVVDIDTLAPEHNPFGPGTSIGS